MFPRHELPELAKTDLASLPESISTSIAAHAMAAKGLDAADEHLRKAITLKAVQVLRRMERRGQIVRVGKAATSVVWRAA